MKAGLVALVIGAVGAGSAAYAAKAPKGAPFEFQLSFPAERSGEAQDGRMLLMLSTDPSDEPRNQIGLQPSTQIVFGATVDHLAPGQAATIDAKAIGWPIDDISKLPAGDYVVQGLLNRYETFHRADGVTIKLAPDRGEGQHWNLAPGNFYSKPVKLHIDPAKGGVIKLSLDQEIAPLPPIPDTKYVRHVRIQSALLTKFWGRPVFIGAHVLVPEGFDQHPEAHFPIIVAQNHFERDFADFRETPPDPDLKPDYSERFHLAGYNRIVQQEAYKNYQQWISAKYPRFLIAEIEHANPYYDDSYAVNSANLGPYGDAINQELIPAIEKQFRGIGQGWARFTYGGSTGGWEALASQIFYPDSYNGAFAACPDPIDFRAYTIANLYEDDNMYEYKGAHLTLERPAFRNYLGEVLATQRGNNRYELALGDHGRSGEQYDIWQAVYGPVGKDGYPAPIFDKLTGKIDHEVATYWKEHYDLMAILRRDWATLGPKLAGKIHIYVGRGDNYFLNDAVYFGEETLKSLKNPAYGGEVDYGDKDEHCWNGDHDTPNAYSRLHYTQMYLDKIMKRIDATAPMGADLSSWRY
jgi:hypothetical protein